MLRALGLRAHSFITKLLELRDSQWFSIERDCSTHRNSFRYGGVTAQKFVQQFGDIERHKFAFCSLPCPTMFLFIFINNRGGADFVA